MSYDVSRIRPRNSSFRRDILVLETFQQFYTRSFVSLSNKVTGNSSNVPPPQESRIAIYLVDLKLSRILHLFLARKNVTSWRNETSASYVLPPVQNLYQLTESNYLPLLFTAKFSPRNFRH